MLTIESSVKFIRRIIIASFCIKSPTYHVVLLADVVVLLFLATNFVTATIFVYTIVYFCKGKHDSLSCTRVHARIPITNSFVPYSDVVRL